MFPTPIILALLFLAVVMTVLFAMAVLLAICANFFYGSPRRSYLISTGLFSMIGYLIAMGTIIFLPGTLGYYNGEPQSLKAILWNYSVLISGVVAVFSSIAWQIFIRRKHALPKVLLTCLISVNLLACTNPTEMPASNMSAAREAKKERKELRDSIKKIEPFFQPMGKAEAYDWLGSHNEPGQTYDEYLDSDPTKPTKERQKIYVLPLGKFTPQQKKVIDVAAEYLGVFYDLPVEQMPAQLVVVHPDARYNNLLRVRQIRTGYILEKILKPVLPTDAAALLAFTSDDLYPDSTMNYVFGQASFKDRVGVWSLHRLGEGSNRDTFLRRTIKIAAHETGHMFTIWHCIKYECVMSGSNHIAETDRRPIDACPECMAKIAWLSDIEPATRYKNLAEFCRKNGLQKEAAEFDRKASAVK